MPVIHRQAIVLFRGFDKIRQGVFMATLKDYAKKAKARMKSGFWEEINKKRQLDIDSAESAGKSKDVVLKEYREVLTRQLFVQDSEEDELLYKKVCELLLEEAVILNPIGLLADKEKMSRMDESAKQQYILELSNKFKEMKERFYQESRLSLVYKK